MNVSLTPELENFVDAKVTSGSYTSASEVVREALRLLEEHDSTRAARLLEFNSELRNRLADLDRGKTVNPDAVRAKLRRKSEEGRELHSRRGSRVRSGRYLGIDRRRSSSGLSAAI